MPHPGPYGRAPSSSASRSFSNIGAAARSTPKSYFKCLNARSPVSDILCIRSISKGRRLPPVSGATEGSGVWSGAPGVVGIGRGCTCPRLGGA